MKMKRNRRKGMALLMAAAAVMLLSLVGIGVLRSGLDTRMQAARATAEMTAHTAADAGFTRALFEMNTKLNISPWNFAGVPSSMTVTLPNVDAAYAYNIQEVIANEEYRITSVGTSNRSQKTVTADVKMQGLFDYALFARGWRIPKHEKHAKGEPKPLKKGGKIKIKGYNIEGYTSDAAGTYSGSLQIRSNTNRKGAIKFEEDVVIAGDVIAGPGSQINKVVEMKNGAVVTGDIYVAAEMATVKSITVPTSLASGNAKDFTYKEGVAISGKKSYDKFKIPKGKVQEINGDVEMYVAGEMKIEDGGSLIIPADGSLTLFIGGEKFEVKGKDTGGIINQTLDPAKLKIFGLDSNRKVKIDKNATDFYGAIYAPNAKVDIKDSLDIYGAIVGWEIKMNPHKGTTATYYFDEALRTNGNVSVSDNGGMRFMVKNWREQ